MARAYGLDLRRCVVDAIEGGLSARAAARFSVVLSTAITWHRQEREAGSLDPGCRGKPAGSKLDEHEAFILGLVEDSRDIALHETAAKLAAEPGVRVCRATLWYVFSKRGLTHKKRQALHRNNNTSEQQRPDVRARRQAWVRPRPRAADLHRRDRRQYQDGAAPGLGPMRGTLPRQHTVRPLENHGLDRRPTARRHRPALGGRADSRLAWTVP